MKLQIAKAALLSLPLFLSVAALSAQIPAVGLCNTGLTPVNPLPEGCVMSVPVTPLNPPTGGPSVDGNWELATPYPSASYLGEAPDPCLLPSYGPAWTDTPPDVWYNPNDGVSQWISPFSQNNTLGGWYVYRTAFPSPRYASGVGSYLLNVKGRLLADDAASAIVLKSGSGCSVVSLPSLGTGPALFPANLLSWSPFSFKAILAPDSTAYLYVLVFNVDSSNGPNGNASGLRVEFTSAYFTPE